MSQHEIKLVNGLHIDFEGTAYTTTLRLLEGNYVLARTSERENFLRPVEWATRAIDALVSEYEQAIDSNRRHLLERIETYAREDHRLRDKLASIKKLRAAGMTEAALEIEDREPGETL